MPQVVAGRAACTGRGGIRTVLEQPELLSAEVVEHERLYTETERLRPAAEEAGRYRG
jgi:hypothetical protein